MSTKPIYGEAGVCTSCSKAKAQVFMWGYSTEDIELCSNCALQLLRKLSEDLCELLTPGGRHG